MINLLRIWIQDNNEETKQKEILFEGKRQALMKYASLLAVAFNIRPRQQLESSAIQLQLLHANIDPLHKWRLILNNNTWYILSLTFMFQDKENFT